MKHNFKITAIILLMFVIAQFIGLYVINSDPLSNPALSWLQPPEIQQQSDFGVYFTSIIFAFVIAILLLFLLTKFKIDFILRIWFFLVVAIALFISLIAFFQGYIYLAIPLALVAITLSFIKIFKRNFLIHNLTELLIYPGIATIFVTILNLWSVMILLLIISIYDIWAVWHSGIMQKMAKYQINNLKIFPGFFVPYVSKKIRLQMKKMKKSKLKKRKIKINIAILGGGDVVFPIITSGVILNVARNGKFPGFLSGLAKPLLGIPGLFTALFVVFGATLGLTLLFLFSEKKKFYPAMPFITGGIFIGLILSYFLS
jgi:presenilin-like A22 family membrane protease